MEAPTPQTITEITARIEAWLAENFEAKLGFDIAAALKTLDHFGLGAVRGGAPF